jgi:hypothetical protein
MMRMDFQLACYVHNNIPRLPKLKRHSTFRILAPRTSVVVYGLLIEFWNVPLIYVVVIPTSVHEVRSERIVEDDKLNPRDCKLED